MTTKGWTARSYSYTAPSNEANSKNKMNVTVAVLPSYNSTSVFNKLLYGQQNWNNSTTVCVLCFSDGTDRTGKADYKCTFLTRLLCSSESHKMCLHNPTHQVGCNILWNNILYTEGESYCPVFTGLQLAFHNSATITQRKYCQSRSTFTHCLTSLCSWPFRTFLWKCFCSGNRHSTMCLRRTFQVTWCTLGK